MSILQGPQLQTYVLVYVSNKWKTISLLAYNNLGNETPQKRKHIYTYHGQFHDSSRKVCKFI